MANQISAALDHLREIIDANPAPPIDDEMLWGIPQEEGIEK
jgi:hypothetical protein